MPEKINQFYECDNTKCRLRFPAAEGHPRWNRCPACRSTIHLAAFSHVVYEVDPSQVNEQPLPLEVILDNIRSAWNVGSIFRTADGAGLSRLYLCGITPTPENSKVGKTALGAELSVPWEKNNNAVLLAQELKSKGYTLWALEDLPGALPMFQSGLDLPALPLVLVVGNEVSGIDPGVIELCDEVLAIPMQGKKQSYNVAVAFGIAASYLLYRQSFSHGSRKILPNT